MSGPTADIKPGNCLPIANIPLGTLIHNVEIKPGTVSYTHLRTYTCTVCGKHLNEAIPAEGHEWGKWVTLRAATEDRPGEQERTCQVCGAKQTREVDYQGDMPKTGVFTVPTAWLVAALALSLTGYIALKRKSERG